jgi:hypothetical protein
MATTTNYGWTTPDDTALVKDGAAAIRTLGSSVDTTTKALNPSTTLGDIEYRSSTANTNTRLGIGSTGNVLTVAGGVPSWAAPSSGALTLIGTTNFSGVASQSVNDVFSSTYDNYIIYISDLIASAGTPSVYVRLRVSAADNTTTNYALNYIVRSNSSLTSGQSLSGDAWDFGSISATQRSFRELKLSSVNKAQTTAMQTVSADNYSNTTALGFAMAAGAHAVSTAFTGLTLYPSSGNITGAISVYGVSK